MVLGLRSKNRKGASVQVDYLIHVKEIKPWPPSQAMKTAQVIFLQWENRDQSSGSFTSNVGDGKVEFSESFRLPLILCKEASRKGTSRDSFQKNCLEFNLYEPRKDKAMKGQLLGSAGINLADYGIINDAITVCVPINFKKSSKSMVQPMLYVDIQPFDRENSSLLKEVSLDKDGSETVSEVTNEGNEEESEIASFTDDDDDNVSSQSSLTASSFALGSIRGSPGQYDKNGSCSANSGTRRADGEPALPSGVAPSISEVNSVAQALKHENRASSSPPSTDLSSKKQNPVNNLAAKVVLSDDYFNEGKKLNHLGSEKSQTDQEVDVKARRRYQSGIEGATTSELHVNLMKEKAKLELHDTGQNAIFSEVKKHALEEQLFGQLPQDGMTKQVNKLRSNTLAINREATGVQGNTRRDKLKHLKSVQLQFHSESDEPLSDGHFVGAKRIDASGNVAKGGRGYAPSEREETENIFSDNKVKLESKVEMTKEMSSEATIAETGPTPVVSEPRKFAHKIQLMEKDKEINFSKSLCKDDVSHTPSEGEENKNSFFENRINLVSKVEMLEEELMEAAAVEVGLYSVVAEHGSSANKVLAPARRLSRFYLHTCKANSLAKKASAARAILSGLVLVTKACGNDVPRLTFWLSNAIVLRAIVTQSVEKLQVAAAPSINNNSGRKGLHESSPHEEGKTNQTESSDEWEETQTHLVALEKVESWIFSRIVESVWWQTLTPHMQSAAVKGSSTSSTRKAHTKRNGSGDQEQGNVAIDLWKKAFKDAFERLCPIRAGGYECCCLPVLHRLVMEQLVGRLDVAMFNAILRESAEEMPTDPVSDPISDPKVLPIPAGRSSFGAGAQLKNAVGNWSRWLTDLFGMDDYDSPEHNGELDSYRLECETSFKAFHLLNALSDLMMLPFELVADSSTRKEVCPTFGAPMIKRVLINFVPDEFNPNPFPEAILDALDSEDGDETGGEYITVFPCIAAPTVYLPPSAASLKNIMGEAGNQNLHRSGSAVVRKSYTSDDELDELDSPITSIFVDNSRASPASPRLNWMQKGKWGRKVVRYQLLREVWMNGE